MVGKSFIKGARLSMEFVLNLLAHGSTVRSVFSIYYESIWEGNKFRNGFYSYLNLSISGNRV